MCLILHIETATDVCSVSLGQDGQLIEYKEMQEGRSHAGTLAVFIKEILNHPVLKTGKPDAIAVSMGPGSYTGLRIGISTAKGLCYGFKIPLIAVPTLESMYNGLTQQLTKQGEVFDDNTLFIPMLDARRMEVYTCIFNIHNEMIEETQALIVDQNTYIKLLKNHKIYFFGSGAEKFSTIITDHNARIVRNFQASSLYMISVAYRHYQESKFENVAYFEPYYLKNFITTVPKKKVL